MNFGLIIKSDCQNVPPPPDARCSDPAFALANPDICQIQTRLVIKPGSVLLCLLGSVQFRAFLVKNGIETDVTNETIFTSSTENVIVGAASGNATGVISGDAIITATYKDMTAQAEVTVLAEENCCDQISVGMMVLVDNSKSMSLAFNSTYSSRLDYAKAAAYRFISEINEFKDLVGLIKFNGVEDSVLSDPTANKLAVQAMVSGIEQSAQSTEFFNAITSAIAELDASTADRKVIVIISDGEDQQASYATNSPIDLCNQFKLQGGTVICLGVRASGRGFNFLNTLATGGFFVNSYGTIAQTSLDVLSGLKGYICAGNCTPAGDETVAKGELNYSNFINWDVEGHVDLIGNGFIDLLPGNGLYVDLAGSSSPFKGRLTSKTPYAVSAGKQYRLSLALAGNQRVDASPETILIQVYSLAGNVPTYYLNQTVSINDFAQPFTPYSYTFTAPLDTNVYISFQQTETPAGSDATGLLLDSVKFENVTDIITLLDDTFDQENLQYVPPACGMGTTPIFQGYVAGGTGNLVPAMTDYTVPSGEVSSSGETVPGGFYASWKAFDGIDSVLGNPNHYWLSGFGLPQFLQYKFDSPQVIKSFTLKAIVVIDGVYVGMPISCPSDFIFAGSNDGVTWTTLHQETNFLDWSPLVTSAEFTIASPGSYQYYRITASKTIQPSGQLNNYFGLDGMELNGDVAESPVFGYAVGYDCYGVGCMSQPPAAQLPDPNPLSDIEAGYVPPKLYTSTKQGCASCPTGFENVPTTSLVPVMTSNTEPSGVVSASSQYQDVAPNRAFTQSPAPWWSDVVNLLSDPQWIQYKFDAAQVVTSYSLGSLIYGPQADPAHVSLTYTKPVSFVFQGSDDGATWTTLDSQSNVLFFLNSIHQYEFTNTTAYQYYRLTFSAIAGNSFDAAIVIVGDIRFYGPVPAQICESATATSLISQADADAKAVAAAVVLGQAQLNCVPVFTSTQQYTANCGIGSLGNPVTKSATAKSFISQADADSKALSAAQAAALAALDCTGSNNGQNITIRDNASATPYPSVKYVSGLTGHVTKVTVAINKLTHQSPKDIVMFLRAPDGSTCELMRHCGAQNAISNVDLVFDDAAGSSLPDNAFITSGSYKPTQLFGAPALPSPAPARPYGTTLAAFNGIVPNGSWSLWIMDDTALGTGSITGIPAWNLTITTA